VYMYVYYIYIHLVTRSSWRSIYICMYIDIYTDIPGIQIYL
jgi:hypothetical protein